MGEALTSRPCSPTVPPSLRELVAGYRFERAALAARELGDRFVAAYGLHALDHQKLALYQLLDELF